MENGLLYVLAFSAMAIALFACVLPQAQSFTEITGIPDEFEVVAEGTVYEIVNSSVAVNLVQWQAPSDANYTVCVGGWVRVSTYVSGSPQMIQNFVDVFGTSRSIAMRYGGGGGYIVNFVGIANFQVSSLTVRNGSLVYITINSVAGCTFTAYAWISVLRRY